jgi:enoyl-CoA hydratase/carnithine racemase
MGYEHILVEATDGIGTITMNRPAQRNALSEAHLAELLDALRGLGDDLDCRAVILAANGPVFSAGHDFSDMVGRDEAGMRRLLELCAEVTATIQRLPVPVVAQVQGLATAAGCQLVATADLAVCAEEAAFAAPGGAGGWFCHTPMVAIARVVSRKRAAEMGFTGDRIDAATALAWGLVNRVVPSERLVEETRTLARAASRGSRASKALGKRVMWQTVNLDVADAYVQATDAMAASAVTADGREAMAAFLEKRPGKYPSRR